MLRGSNHGHSYDNRQYGWDATPPDYVRMNPGTGSHPHNLHLVFDDNRIMLEEERPVAGYYPDRVVFEEDHSIPVHKNHRHGSMEPRKQVHFVEHKERITESFDNKGNRRVYEESVDTEADGFIKRKHKNFELNKFGTFNSYY